MSFLAGHIYPLTEPDRYDDDLGLGYDHVAIAHDAQPGACVIHDAWIVNREGKVHPGYDCNPVPIRVDDVNLAAGRQLVASLPAPVSIFDGPWARGR